MKWMLFSLFVVAGIVLPNRGAGAEEVVVGGFPLIGAEYVMGRARAVLPEEACDDGHILILEHGFGPWFRVAYNYPSQFSWKPAESATVWINLDHLTFLQQVPEDCRLIRYPKGE